MNSKESTGFVVASAIALFSLLLAVLAHFVFHGWVGTFLGIVGAVINVVAVCVFPLVPGSGSIKKAVFVFMGVPAFVTAAVFGFVMYSLGGGFIYLLFTFVLYLLAFAIRR